MLVVETVMPVHIYETKFASFQMCAGLIRIPTHRTGKGKGSIPSQLLPRETTKSMVEPAPGKTSRERESGILLHLPWSPTFRHGPFFAREHKRQRSGGRWQEVMTAVTPWRYRHCHRKSRLHRLCQCHSSHGSSLSRPIAVPWGTW